MTERLTCSLYFVLCEISDALCWTFVRIRVQTHEEKGGISPAEINETLADAGVD